MVFEGPPECLEAYLPVAPDRRRDVVVLLDSGAGLQAVRCLTAAAGDHTLVRLVLPSTLAAQGFPARVEVGDDHFEAVVQVTQRAELDCLPVVLDLSLTSRESTVSLRVVNLGNVVQSMPARSAFGLIREGSLDVAIGAALMTSQSGNDRVGALADSLSDAHGGLVRVTLTAGSGALEPGAAVALQARLQLDERVVGGHRYRGTWSLGTLRVPVILSLRPDGGPKRRARAATPSTAGAPS